jgi:hypothetical protein
MSALERISDSRQTRREVRKVPCVDGSGLQEEFVSDQPPYGTSMPGAGAVHHIKSGSCPVLFDHFVGNGEH